MLEKRLIPVLNISQGSIVKTRKFKNKIYIGDPLNITKILNEKEVDELILIDIEASKKALEPDFELIEEIAAECFAPFAYGGGISSIEHAEKIFSYGVEKIIVQSALFSNESLIKELVSRYGSQSVVASVDIKKDMLYRDKILVPKKVVRQNLTIDGWMRKIEDLGVGEVFITDVDREGGLGGVNLSLINKIKTKINLPIIYNGGVKSISDIKQALLAGADAVAAGAFFIFNGNHNAVLISYPSGNEINQILGRKF